MGFKDVGLIGYGDLGVVVVLFRQFLYGVEEVGFYAVHGEGVVVEEVFCEG